MAGVGRRDFLKLLAGLVGGCTFLSPVALRAASATVDVPPTLMLHTKDRWKLEKIMRWITDQGFHSTDYRALAGALSGERPLPEKPVIITIDDIGSHYIQPYFLAMADVVEKAGHRGVFGVVTRDAPSRSPAVWAVLRELAGRGWEMDTHTNSHVILSSLSESELHAEIVESAQRLEDGLGVRSVALIAPYGNVYRKGRTFDPRIFAMAAEAKLTFVAGIVGGRRITLSDTPPFYVGRVGVGVDHVQTGWWLDHFHDMG